MLLDQSLSGTPMIPCNKNFAQECSLKFDIDFDHSRADRGVSEALRWSKTSTYCRRSRYTHSDNPFEAPTSYLFLVGLTRKCVRLYLLGYEAQCTSKFRIFEPSKSLVQEELSMGEDFRCSLPSTAEILCRNDHQ